MRSMNMPRFSTLLLATIILWMLGYAIWLTNYVFEPLPFQLDHSLRGIPVFTLGAVLSLGIGRMLDELRRRAGAKILAIVVIVAVIAATVIIGLFHLLVMFVIAPHWGRATWRGALEQIPMVWMFGAWMLLYFALVADAARRDHEIRLARATAAAIDAQHRLLVQQINPHFLFNTLNTISSFVTSHPEEARGLIAELAALLRDSIDETESEYCPLGRECELAGRYLRIIGVRFGQRFKPSIGVPDSLKTQAVPRRLLLTLIENAVTHGASVLTGDCTLSVYCTSRDRFLIVEVRNHYDARNSSSSGHRGGLAALDARLQALYGDAYQFEYGGDNAGLWCTRVALPISNVEAEQEQESLAARVLRSTMSRGAPT